jgi:hypothetical protein
MKERYDVHPRDPYKFNIHETAKEMVANDYFGQNMLNPEKAENYILLAAYDPDVERKLPTAGFSFWETCEFRYRLWKARRHFNRPSNGSGR